MSSIKHFLLIYDHRKGQLVEEVHFGTDATRALQAYAATEKKYRDDSMLEIVLIGSDSIETVRVTHANYYEGSVALSHFLAGL